MFIKDLRLAVQCGKAMPYKTTHEIHITPNYLWMMQGSIALKLAIWPMDTPDSFAVDYGSVMDFLVGKNPNSKITFVECTEDALRLSAGKRTEDIFISHDMRDNSEQQIRQIHEEMNTASTEPLSYDWEVLGRLHAALRQYQGRAKPVMYTLYPSKRFLTLRWSTVLGDSFIALARMTNS